MDNVVDLGDDRGEETLVNRFGEGVAGEARLRLWKMNQFLDASSHLYMRVCTSVRPSVGRSVRWSVRPSVGPSVTLS